MLSPLLELERELEESGRGQIWEEGEREHVRGRGESE